MLFIKRIALTFGLFSIVLHSSCLFSETPKDELIWAIPNWPPLFINEGSKQGLGTGDQFQTFFSNHLTNYKHKKVLMNYTRFRKYAKEGKKVCMPFLLKTKARQEFSYYTEPIRVGGPQSIMMLKSRAKELLGSRTEVSVEELLTNPSVISTFEADRSYPELDIIIKNNLHRDNVSYKPTTKDRLFAMLIKGRVDFIIESPNSIPSQINTDEIILIKIFEQRHVKNIGHIICAKTEWGLKAIADINAVIREKKKGPGYKAIFYSSSRPQGELELKQLDKNYSTFINM